jgi:hypothetical protein
MTGDAKGEHFAPRPGKMPGCKPRPFPTVRFGRAQSAQIVLKGGLGLAQIVQETSRACPVVRLEIYSKNRGALSYCAQMVYKWFPFLFRKIWMRMCVHLSQAGGIGGACCQLEVSTP